MASLWVPPVAPQMYIPLQMPVTAQLAMASGLPTGNGAAQALEVALQQGSCHQCLAVGILSHPQGLLMQFLLPIPVMVLSVLHLGVKLYLGRHSRGPDMSGVHLCSSSIRVGPHLCWRHPFEE